MANFGWSLPAGVSNLPGEESYYCPVCGEKDFDGVMDDSWPEDLPGQDEYCSIRCAKAARDGYRKEIDENGEPTKYWVSEDGRDAVDAYGHITWSVGTEDDFICFDHCRIGDFMVLQAVVNSETGSFIMNFEYEEVDIAHAYASAVGIVDNAIMWCYDNELEMTDDKWKEGKGRVDDWLKSVKEATEEN